MTPAEPDPSDEQLAAAAQAGSDAAWSRLTERYADRLLHFFWRRTAQPADAEDLCQETFLRGWRKLDRYDPRRRFAAWLFTLADRLAIDHHRRGRVRGTVPLGDRPDAATEASMQLIARETRDNLWALAARVLPAEPYEALWLRYGEDLAPGEIARVMRRNPVNVRVMLLRARRRLKAALEREAQFADARHVSPMMGSTAPGGPKVVRADDAPVAGSIGGMP